MLPRVNVVVPTDAFYALSMDEARDLNEDGGDIITGEDFPRGREAGEEGATFRIATRGANGATVYQYYDAATLWRWAQDHRTDPLRNPWWYEDWMALRSRYAYGSPVPAWVDALPRSIEVSKDELNPPCVVYTPRGPVTISTTPGMWSGMTLREVVNLKLNPANPEHLKQTSMKDVVFASPYTDYRFFAYECGIRDAHRTAISYYLLARPADDPRLYTFK